MGLAAALFVLGLLAGFGSGGGGALVAGTGGTITRAAGSRPATTEPATTPSGPAATDTTESSSTVPTTRTEPATTTVDHTTTLAVESPPVTTTTVETTTVDLTTAVATTVEVTTTPTTTVSTTTTTGITAGGAAVVGAAAAASQQETVEQPSSTQWGGLRSGSSPPRSSSAGSCGSCAAGAARDRSRPLSLRRQRLRETRSSVMASLSSPPERFLSRPVRSFWVGVALLGVVAFTAVVVPMEPLEVDRRWSEAMQDIRTPMLTDVALVFNALGRGLGWVLSLAAVGIVLTVGRRWLALVAFAVTEALTTLSSSVLKILVGRPRPPDGLVHPVGSSFPSGHAAYGGATCIALVLLFTTPGPRRRPWWPIAGLGILGMAWSRTYLEVHWLSDVVGGSLLGVGISLAVFGGAQQAVRVGMGPVAHVPGGGGARPDPGRVNTGASLSRLGLLRAASALEVQLVFSRGA